MRKIQGFSITLNSPRQVFYPGETVYGQVNMTVIEPVKMRGLRIELEGEAHCHWSETHGSGENKRTVHYTGHQDILKLVSVLFGNLPHCGGDKIMHPEGSHVYQFQFQLPSYLPSSFEGGTGRIRYTLKAVIDRPWRFDHKVRYPLIINELIDTNRPEYAMNKPSGNESKQVGCLCCVAGMLAVQGGLDRGAYCPGEYLLITAHCNNGTTRDMDAMNAKLVQVIKYHARNKTKTRTKTISRIAGQPIPQKEDCTWTNQALQIPGTCPTINNAVVEVTYYVEVHVDVPWGIDLRLYLPVVIGTIPYRPVYNVVQDYGPILPPSYESGMVPQPTAGIAPPPPTLFGYPDIPPPSYAAAIGDQDVHVGDGDDKVEWGNQRYIPFYTYATPHQGPTPDYGAYPPPSYNQALGATAPPMVGNTVVSVQPAQYT